MEDENVYEPKVEIPEVERTEDGGITDKAKLIAAKQILLGLGIIGLATEALYIYNPSSGESLLQICTTVIPPLATLIIAFYFKDKSQS